MLEVEPTGRNGNETSAGFIAVSDFSRAGPYFQYRSLRGETDYLPVFRSVH